MKNCWIQEKLCGFKGGKIRRVNFYGFRNSQGHVYSSFNWTTHYIILYFLFYTLYIYYIILLYTLYIYFIHILFFSLLLDRNNIKFQVKKLSSHNIKQFFFGRIIWKLFQVCSFTLYIVIDFVQQSDILSEYISGELIPYDCHWWNRNFNESVWKNI